MKSGTGLYWLKEAASRLMQISTLSPAVIRTAALFSSSKICHCKEAHRSSMKSSGKTEVRSLNLGLQMQVTVLIQHELLFNPQGSCVPKLDLMLGPNPTFLTLGVARGITDIPEAQSGRVLGLCLHVGK